jgi:tetratricopeptide (TPR) repeat protein
MSRKNLAYARLAQGKGEEAVANLQKAVEIYANLVDVDGQKDLAAQYARALNPLAWVYATSPDPRIRNGQKAKEYAFKACELTDWKGFLSLEALAAASAESGTFSEAIKWQEWAIDCAPLERRPDLRSRLELYRSGKPYHVPTTKAE